MAKCKALTGSAVKALTDTVDINVTVMTKVT